MGGACVCNRQISESWLFWSRLNIRKITFQEYTKIFEEKRLDWLKCLNKKNEFSIEISECETLRDLLNSPDFSDKERIFFFEKLKKFISKQTDKLQFFTSLSFLTIIEPLKENTNKNFSSSNNNNKNKKFSLEEEAKNYIETLKKDTIQENFDIIFEQLLKMAIKKDEHYDVTKIFIELVSEFTIDFLHLEPRNKKDLTIEYSKEPREKLFLKLVEKPNKKFYEFMFNEKNVKMITDDLSKISQEIVCDSKNTSILDISENVNDKNLIKVDFRRKTDNKINNSKAIENSKAISSIGRI